MLSLKHVIVVVLTIGVLFVASACRNQSEASFVPEPALTEEPPAGIAAEPEINATAGPSAEPNPDALTQYITTESGLKYWVIEQGDGPMPQPGDTVTVKYRGTLEDGTEFDSGEYTFVLGTGAVIPGWDEGIGLLNEGTKAELVLPPDLGYGSAGNGPIPPNATLIFEVELLSVDPGE
jgi:peptidylprolyl isomerase